MSNIDKRALREAAEKATKGQWTVEFDDEIYSTDGVNNEQIAMVFSENEARDAAFIAAANPAAALALLDEIDSLESFRTAFTEFHDKTEWVQGDKRFDVITPWGKHRADALKQYIDHLEGRLEAAEKRIAELSHHLQCAHAFIEHTEAFGYEASNGIMCCGDAQWNIDASKSALAAAGKGE